VVTAPKVNEGGQLTLIHNKSIITSHSKRKTACLLLLIQ